MSLVKNHVKPTQRQRNSNWFSSIFELTLGRQNLLIIIVHKCHPYYLHGFQHHRCSSKCELLTMINIFRNVYFQELENFSKLIYQKPLYNTYYDDYICVHDRTLLFCSSIGICLFKQCQGMPALKGSPINRTDRIKYIHMYTCSYTYVYISFYQFLYL